MPAGAHSDGLPALNERCAACPHADHGYEMCGSAWDEHVSCTCTEGRPGYILAMRAQALDVVQELIWPADWEWEDPPMPTQKLWNEIVEAAFPPSPMAGE